MENAESAFLITCGMLNSIIGTYRLHDVANDRSNYMFDNEDIECTIKKVYKAYNNIDINNLNRILNANIINDLVLLIVRIQPKISKAVLFMKQY